jgi:hypothetical protein
LGADAAAVPEAEAVGAMVVVSMTLTEGDGDVTGGIAEMMGISARVANEGEYRI